LPTYLSGYDFRRYTFGAKGIKQIDINTIQSMIAALTQRDDRGGTSLYYRLLRQSANRTVATRKTTTAMPK